MPINKAYLIKARQALEEKRLENRQKTDARRAEVLAKIPEYGELEIKLTESMARTVSLVMNKSSESIGEVIEKIASENLDYQKKQRELLIANGFPENYTDEIYDCKICLDKGTINGEWCDCLKRIARKIAANELNERSPLSLSTFESYDLSVFSDKFDEKASGVPRELMTQIYNDCISFAENFDGKGKGLFMTGRTGLGKTHLSLAIARRVIEKDFCAVYNSVPELLRTIDAEQFGRSEGDSLSAVSDCDLLILDDLGAENNTERNASLLYEIINGRLCRGLPAIVSTNLNEAELKARYNDRLLSRLFAMDIMCFCGNDYRVS